MEISQIYLLIAIIVLLLLISLTFLFPHKTKNKRLSPLASMAFGCILIGMFFEEHRWLGYGFFTVGILLSVIDIYRKYSYGK